MPKPQSSKFRRFDKSKLRIRPLSERKNSTSLKHILNLNASAQASFIHEDLTSLAKAVARASKKNREVVLCMGAHPIKCGYSRFIIDLMERGIITHIATTGAVPIHDFEFSLIGETSEHVEGNIVDGRFGNWHETGEYMNHAVIDGYNAGRGFGESIGRMIQTEELCPIPHKDISVFAAAHRLKIPITVHKGIGQDIIDQHPRADFAAIGKTSGDDFLIFTDTISKLEGGVFMCWGSQIMGPEIYLKALSMARNVAHQKNKKISKFTTAVFDNRELGDWRSETDATPLYNKDKHTWDDRWYFRPMKTILIRTIKDGGKSFYIKGDFNVTIPAFHRQVLKLLKSSKKRKRSVPSLKIRKGPRKISPR